VTPEERREQLYRREEEELARRRSATVRRGPIGLVAVGLVVALVVGITAAVDLRRLTTPRGTALAWTGALLFGDCAAYDRLTAGLTGPARTRCTALRSASEAARDRPSDVDFSIVRVEQTGPVATVVVRTRVLDRPAVDVPLPLHRTGGRWRVQPTGATCVQLPCPAGR
jgi:hypothetical protein